MVTSLNQPETLAQARRFQSWCGRYRAAGLCNMCAAQAAYGHAHGWRVIEPPCPRCLPVLATFPRSVRGSVAWRSLDPTHPPGFSHAPVPRGTASTGA